ncbi:hypothetical protein SSPIM334S_01940 [Streptomyces spiroverticillatus]
MRIDELLVDGSRFAARCRLSSDHRKLGHLDIDFFLFGEVAEDSRVRRVDQLGRTLKTAS